MPRQDPGAKKSRTMKIESTETLKIKLKGKDAERFKAALGKLSKSNIGFSSAVITTQEQNLFKQLSKKINNE